MKKSRSTVQGTAYQDNPIFDWLALERAPRVGPLTIARLINGFGSPRSALEASPDEIRRRTGIGEKLAREISEYQIPEQAIIRDMRLLESLGARITTRWDPAYPSLLKEIYDPPALLFVRGEILAEDGRAVAIVGTRNPTRYGLDVAESIAADLARSGITIVSGLARGIDTAAHRAALKAGGRSIGVQGCGLDIPYPRENKGLVEELIQSGAVITEFRPGIPPLPTNFFRRNRVVSGLSKGVVVVEATRKSGSLITAEHAVDQNRDVFAVPGNLMNMRSQGPHHLIKQGAALVESANDIAEALFKAPEKKPQPTLFPAVAERDEMSDTARAVLEAIDPDPVAIDILCQSLTMEPGKLSGILLELELKGMIRQFPGKMFARVLG